MGRSPRRPAWKPLDVENAIGDTALPVDVPDAQEGAPGHHGSRSFPRRRRPVRAPLATPICARAAFDPLDVELEEKLSSTPQARSLRTLVAKLNFLSNSGSCRNERRDVRHRLFPTASPRRASAPRLK